MSAEKTPADWVKRLGREEEAHVVRAQKALSQLLEDDSHSAEAARALLQEVQREDARARKEAFSLLQAFWWPPPAEMAEDAISAVLKGLEYVDAEEPQEVEDAVLLLNNLVRAAPENLSRMVQALEHSWHTVRWAAASVLGRQEVDREVLARLVTLLEDDSADVQRAALESIGAMALKDPALTAPLLLAQAVDRDGSERYMALASLRGLLESLEQKPDALAQLKDPQDALKLLEDEQAPIRLEAAAVLGLIGRADEATVLALRKPLRDKNPDVGAAAAVSLLQLLEEDGMAVGTLGTLLCSPSEKDSGAALTVLEMLDTTMLRRAAPALELAMNRAATELVRNEAKGLLAKLAEKKKKA